MSDQITHVGFSDESNWNKGRFRSLGLVSLPLEHLESLQAELIHILHGSGIRHEFKWEKLSGARERFAAEKVCDFVIRHACSGKLRVDVLVWDVEDSRHNIKGRDDIANLQRMYYHLFRNVLRMRWPDGAVWKLFPDEHTAMDWHRVEDYLDVASVQVEVDLSLFTKGRFKIMLRREFRIYKIVQSSSKEMPFLQIADLFSGLAVFSRQKFAEYQKWLQQQSAQKSLFSLQGRIDAMSKADKVRFTVLKYFYEQCKSSKLGVSLKTYRGLTTPNPANFINFWFYVPKHPNDKAPTKKRKNGSK